MCFSLIPITIHFLPNTFLSLILQFFEFDHLCDFSNQQVINVYSSEIVRNIIQGNLTMTYFDSAEGEVITRERVLVEFKKHKTSYEDQEEFFIGFPADCDQFNAQDVLLFLGY